MSSKEQYHAVCNECGGKGCAVCHDGWQCTMEDIGICNKCDEPLYLREDDNPTTIQQRLTVYHKQTEPVINYYSKQGITKFIDSKGSINEYKAGASVVSTSPPDTQN